MRTGLLFLLLSVCMAQSATYYVATSGNDSNDGSIGSPWLTIGKGTSTVAAGDTLLVGAGTYPENAQANSNSGTLASPIIINGQNVATVGSFSLSRSNIHLLNFTISGGTNSNGGLLFMDRTADDCVVSNNQFQPNLNQALNPIIRWSDASPKPFGDAGDRNLIIRNIVTDSRSELVFRVYGAHNTIHGNQMLDSDNSDFMHLYGQTNYVIGNLVSNIYESGIHTNHADFVQTLGINNDGSEGHIIESNTVVALHVVAQLAQLSSDTLAEIRNWTFRNNMFVGVAAKATIEMPGVHWHNNLFYNCATNTVNGGTVINVTDGVARGRGDSCQIFNNVFVDCGITGQTNIGGYSVDTTLTNCSADFNFMVNRGLAMGQDSMQRSIGDAGGWDKFLWWEDNGINGGDPMLLAITYKPSPYSLLIDSGTNLSGLFTTDIEGTTRETLWDIGAYEVLVEGIPQIRAVIRGGR